MTAHGGNIHSFARKYTIPEDNVIDFSASINPLGLSPIVLREIKNIKSSICYYPDPETKKLRETLSSHLNLPQELIICGNGSTELIYLCVRTLKPNTVLIPAPTFSEYERACLLSGAKIKYFRLKQENNFDLKPEEFMKRLEGTDIAFICNPNNPTGRLIEREGILEIAKRARKLKCYLVVDEAFIDFLPEHSIIKEVERNPYLIVLRSMTKFYAFASLRLGYGVFHPSLIKALLLNKEPWTVNTIAQRAGEVVLNDTTYKEKTFKVIKHGKSLMEDGLRKLSIEFVPSVANFYLLKIPNAQKIISALQKAYIMVRDCSNFRGLDDTYIRVAVKSPREIKRLLEELSKV